MEEENSDEPIRDMSLTIKCCLYTREFRIVHYDVFTEGFVYCDSLFENDVYVIQQRIKWFNLDFLSVGWKFRWSNRVMGYSGVNNYTHKTLDRAVERLIYIAKRIAQPIQSKPTVVESNSYKVFKQRIDDGSK